MGIANTYYGLALDDFESAKERLDSGSMRYNKIAVDCQQASEKFLKHAIEFLALDPNLLRSHNLQTLVEAVLPHANGCNEDIDYSTDARYLKAFYYDARYPGDNFVEVTERQAKKCFNIAASIKTLTDKIISGDPPRLNLF